MTNPTPQPMAPQPAAPLTAAEDKQWASFAHFGGILGFLPSLIIYLVFKDRGLRTRHESKEALNWQITWVIVAIVLGIVSSIVAAAAFGLVVNAPGAYLALTGIFGFISWLPYIANFVFSIVAGVRVNGGGAYRYPFAFRFIK